MARTSPMSPTHPTDRILGNCPAIDALRAQIRHLAPFDAVGHPSVPTVLLHGETGTGKGLVARVIHDSGPRAQGPFVDVHCAAIPETLLEAELFGYEAGAFTDAKRTKPGLFEAASTGTLFLDEIDALPLPLQSKLLTAIEEKRVRRVGAIAAHAVDVKLIAATQADLSSHVAAGRFRTDLYHRLAVIVLTLPPLRERGEDVLLLAQQWLRQYAEGHGLAPKRLSGAAEVWLQNHDWPGNVRELSHLMERVTLLSSETIIDPATLERLGFPQPSAPPMPTLASADRALSDEVSRIAQALSLTGGNVLRAARLLGMSRDAVRYRMRKYGITLPLPQLSPAVTREEPDARNRPLLSSLSTPILPRRRPAKPAESVAPPAPILPQRETLFVPPGEPRAVIPSWEQKPVAVLALELTWPAAAEGEAPRYEPWTATQRWEQVILEKVRGFGGVLLQRSPSLLLVAFGIPDTLEQLPQRAVQAALALRQLVAARPAGECGPELRQAVHWGQLLVDVAASDPTARLLAVGETLAQPVRLLDRATPGGIVVSSEVSRLVEAWFELRAHKALPGDVQPDRVGAYTVFGYKAQAVLLMYRQWPLSRFVSRAHELTALENLLAYAENGRGQAVGIVGEPGVGKSRLCYEFIRAHSTHGWLILETSTDSYGQATPYLPVIDLLKSYFQIAGRDDVPTRRNKVTDKLCTLDQSLRASLPALLTLLDIPVEDSTWQALDPPQRRQRILDAIKHLLLCESQVQPLCLVVENLHWIDGETQAFLDSLVESLPAARVLLLVSYRPEYHHSWTSKTYYSQLRLDPLPLDSARELAHAILGRDPSIIPLIRRLVELTEGNPFFLEESIQTLVDMQALTGERGAYRLAKALQYLQVPATVHMVLASRIDRLPVEGKRLLQLAAVIGKDVPFSLLQAIVELPAEALRQGLSQLQRIEFLYERNVFPEFAYTFKHALTHEVAYGSLQPEQRRALHARIIEAIEALSTDRLAEQVEQLAHHALRGEVWEKAMGYCRQAGEKALARSAHREAVEYFEAGLSALSHLPEDRDTRARAIDLRLALRSALYPSSDSGRILAALGEAESLAVALDDQRRLGQVSLFLSDHFRRRGAYDQAIASAQRTLAVATASGDTVLHALANQRLGLSYWVKGDYRRAIDRLGQTLASIEGARRCERFGQGFLPTVVSRAYLATCHAELGTFAEGCAIGDEGLLIAEAIDHPGSLMLASWGVGLLALRQGDLRRALPRLERAMSICQDGDLPLFFPRMAWALGAAYALGGRVTDTVPLLTQALEQPTSTGRLDNQALCRLSLGEAKMLAGRLEEAQALAEGALAHACEHQERGHQAYALRLLGEIAVHRDPPEVERAGDHYRQALTLAEELSMRPLQAHCHLGLGTLYAKIGRREQARAELCTAIELYRAMDMTFWLPQTEVVLAQVAAR